MIKTMSVDAYKQRIRDSVESWKDAARDGKDRPRRKNNYGTEREAQGRVIAWLEGQGVVCFHPANAGARNPATALSQGIRAGVPDIIIATPPPVGGHRAAAIEMKRTSGGSVSMAQLDWHDKLRACGWAVKVCAGAADAITWLQSLGYGR